MTSTMSLPGNADELFIDDAAARRIASTLKRQRRIRCKPHWGDESYRKVYSPDTFRLCTHDKQDSSCTCLVPLWTRQLTPLHERFTNPPKGGYNWRIDEHNIARDYSTALLHHEDMLPLLQMHRLVKQAKPSSSEYHPRNTYYKTFRCALMPFLALNLLLEMPETWDPEAKGKPWHDYRDTAFYQIMMKYSCNGNTEYGDTLEFFPNNSFFDVPDDNWPLMPWVKKAKSRVPHKIARGAYDFRKDPKVDYGALPFDRFVASRKTVPRRLPHGQHELDEVEVSISLRRRGLPAELIDIIIGMVDVEEQPWELVIKDDPLHPSNRRVLESYLDYCWHLMVCSWLASEDFGGNDTSATQLEEMVREAVRWLICQASHNPYQHRWHLCECAAWLVEDEPLHMRAEPT